MEGIYCQTCKHKETDEWVMPCRGCKVTRHDEPPTGYEQEDIPVVTVEEVEPSAVDHPSHYQSANGMECIDEMLMVFGVEAVKNFCLCNVWKYRYRADAKNGQEDRDKADWYMRKYKELVDREEYNIQTLGGF